MLSCYVLKTVIFPYDQVLTEFCSHLLAIELTVALRWFKAFVAISGIKRDRRDGSQNLTHFVTDWAIVVPH